jgi:hypothetical protein
MWRLAALEKSKIAGSAERAQSDGSLKVALFLEPSIHDL